MKVIVDTNILISAILRDNVPEQIILWLLAQPAVEWVASSEIIAEYQDVLQRKKFNLPVEIVNHWFHLFDEHIQVIVPTTQVDFPRDRKDAKFLECALATNANVFITGDKDFSEAQTLITTSIMTAQQFKIVFIE